MNRLVKYVGCAIALLIVSGSLSSCIREDYADCRSTNYLMLSYKGDGDTEIFNDKIGRVEMFIFDYQDKYVSSSEIDAGQVRSRKVLLPPLPVGDYRIICIGNTYHTSFSGYSTKASPYADAFFADSDYFGRKVLSGNDSLYYASMDYRIDDFDPYSGEGKGTIEFRASHYDVCIEVAGIPSAESLPVIEVGGLLPCTDFENRAFGDAVSYIPATEYDGDNVLRSEFNIMRHTDHTGVNIILLSRSGKEIASVNLAEFLSAHPEVDCSRQEALIPIRIEFKSGNVSITVPDWYITDVNPEF